MENYTPEIAYTFDDYINKIRLNYLELGRGARVDV